MADFDTLWLDAPDERRQAGGVAARALRDNPSNLAVSDDPLVRIEMGYAIFDSMIRDAVESPAGVRKGDIVLAVAGFERPGHCVAAMLPPETRQLSTPGPDATPLDRWLHAGSVMAAHDLPEPHIHVGPVGVEPGFQGMGLGRAAMKLLGDRLDERREIGWLETDKPENVRFYVSLGYEVVDQVEMFGGTYTWWFMRREPA